MGDVALWLMKVRLNKKGKLIKQDPGQNSILIWYELAECILEYSPGKIIISLRPNKFLFLNDWEPVRHLIQNFENKFQNCIKPHPDFSEKDFPFLVCSGEKFYSWINVKENTVNRFIDCGNKRMANADVFFFYPRNYGYSLFFTKESQRFDTTETMLYEMQLKKDFHEKLSKEG